MGACQIERLPEELLAAIISLTSPPDACRAAAVSRAFRSAADSDVVWSCFLPRDIPPFNEATELSLATLPPAKKAMFQRLSDDPGILQNGLTSMWLDRGTGGKCYTLCARALRISWGETPEYWRWIHVSHDTKTGKRSIEAAELLHVCWLEIRGMIQTKMLSPNSTYAAYIVFNLVDPIQLYMRPDRIIGWLLDGSTGLF